MPVEVRISNLYLNLMISDVGLGIVEKSFAFLLFVFNFFCK